MSNPERKNAAARIYLNGPLIGRRRRELGISQRDLGASTGIERQRLAMIENGERHGETRVRELFRLAEGLALAPHALLLEEEVLPANRGENKPDDAVVEAALLESRTRRILVSELAEGLGWTKSRTQTALELLSRRNANGGAALSRTGAGVLIAARSNLLTERQRGRLRRVQHTRRLLDRVEISLMRSIYNGEFGPRALERRTNHKIIAALGRLERDGYVRRTAEGGFEHAPEVAFSLRQITTMPRGQRAAR